MGEAAQAQAGALEVERAAHHRRRAGAGDRDGELRVAGSTKTSRERRQHPQVGATAGRDRERPVAEQVRRAVDDEVGPFAAEVQPAELEAARREPQLHRLARAHREVGHQQLERAEPRLGAHVGGPSERALDAGLAGGDDREPWRQLLLQRAQERVQAGGAQPQPQVRLVGRRREAGTRERQVDAPRAAASVDDHAAVAVSREARLERADAFVPEEEARRAERRLEAGARERALEQQLAGDAAAQAGRGHLHQGAHVDVLDLARAVVDTVVAHAAGEADPAAAEAQLAVRHLGAPRPPARLDARLVVGDAVVAAAASGALRVSLGGAAPPAHAGDAGHLPARRHVPLHEAREVLDRPRGRARATGERVLPAEPADLGTPLPFDLGAGLAQPQRVRRDRLGGGVEAAGPGGLAPRDSGIADLAAVEAALEHRPVERAAPAAAEAAAAREARRLRLGAAERAADPRERGLGRREVVGFDRELQPRAVLRVHLAAHPHVEATAREREALVALPPVLGAPVEAAREGQPAVRAFGERERDPARQAAGPALGPAHVHVAGRGGADAERAPAEQHPQHPLAVGAVHVPAELRPGGAWRWAGRRPRAAPSRRASRRRARASPARWCRRTRASSRIAARSRPGRRRPRPACVPRCAAASRRSTAAPPSARRRRSPAPSGTRAAPARRGPPRPRGSAGLAGARRDGCDRGRPG